MSKISGLWKNQGGAFTAPSKNLHFLNVAGSEDLMSIAGQTGYSEWLPALGA